MAACSHASRTCPSEPRAGLLRLDAIRHAYPTAIYTLEYDGFADFPQYPLNLLADLNAVAGIVYVHPTYFSLPLSQVNNAIELATSPGYAPTRQSPTTT